MDDFLETYQFLNSLDVSHLHVFTYSERANTPAAEMEGAIPNGKRAERSKILHILSDKKRRKFYEENLGRTAHVLFENDIEDGIMHGFTENYVRVVAKYDPVLVNEIVPVNLLRINDHGHVEVASIDEVPVH